VNLARDDAAADPNEPLWATRELGELAGLIDHKRRRAQTGRI
jgi:hypothetical protein